MAPFLPRPSLTPESGILQPRIIEAPTIRSPLPIYERFQDLSYRYASVSQSRPTHLFVAFRTGDEPAVAVVDDICQALHYLGSIWSEDQGLRLNGREYYYTRDSLDRIADLASDITSNVMITFPLQALGALESLALDFVFRAEDKNASGATTEASTAEPAADDLPLEAVACLSRTIDEFGLNRPDGDSVLDLSDQLRREIMNATQKIDRLLDIAERLRRNLLAKASSTTISGVKANLTLLSSAAQTLAGQVDEMLLEEDKLYTWLKDLLDWASLRNTDQKTQKIPLAGTWYNNPWIKRRPRAEKGTFGQWCVYPECPEPGDEETVLVELYVPDVEDAAAELYNTYLLTLQARYIAQKKASDL
ncbi:hypothetical protein NM208_g17030 [Fusarium decemcellulare]|uniref:Uncharacterized protein n=1 Tax=Fusarium decemcellulare TaxID=57161 RepID=A0ACC1R8I1_9HYPO|nr:hypothetical protein NM208_g17030 [Fusarium decemcellulare]